MFKKFLPTSEFSKNVITLVTGTAISQAIPIAISPILTRIYTPDDFGILALYLSISSVLAVVATGRYEFAITLPKEDKDALQILWLSCIISFVFSLLTLVAVVMFNSELTELLGNEEISSWLYFVPATIFITGIYQSFNYWFNRKKKYAKLSKAKVTQSLTTGTLNLSIGFLKKGGAFGLVFGNIVGQFLSAVYFIVQFFRRHPRAKMNAKKTQMLAQAKRYQDFPKYDVMAAFFNVSSNQATHIFFNMFFGAVTSGYFYLGQKIFNIPITLVAASVQDVFKMDVVTVHNAQGNTRSIYMATFKKLLFLAVVPTILLYFFSIDIIVFVFGENWRIAGEFVRILTPVFFMRFISFPLSYMFYVREKQKFNIIGQFLLLSAIITSFYFGRNYDATTTVQFLTVVYCIFYCVYLYISYSLTSKGKSHNIE